MTLFIYWPSAAAHHSLHILKADEHKPEAHMCSCWFCISPNGHLCIRELNHITKLFPKYGFEVQLMKFSYACTNEQVLCGGDLIGVDLSWQPRTGHLYICSPVHGSMTKAAMEFVTHGLLLPYLQTSPHFHSVLYSRTKVLLLCFCPFMATMG